MFEGVLVKMITEIGSPVQYYLNFKSDVIHMNQLIGKNLFLEKIGSQCLNCGSDLPIFRQGFCKKCFFDIPSAGDWIMKPELSKAHLDIEDRDLDYEKKIQLQPHIVYLAVSSGLKVGVTRASQVPTRWIDQGAHSAIPIVETPNRYLAGITEVALKNHYSDKTNWRLMLQNSGLEIDLKAEKNRCLEWIPTEVKPYILHHETAPTVIDFPVLNYPDKVSSLNLEKTLSYTCILTGIKGQYLIFEDQTVFNVRSNEGQVIRLEVK
jgi:hypothetical protein